MECDRDDVARPRRIAFHRGARVVHPRGCSHSGGHDLGAGHRERGIRSGASGEGGHAEALRCVGTGDGTETLATDREFSARLQAVLGIGAAGSGAKAISLLARIQAGQQITTVDDLYKKLVLEEPETMATADAVVAHFDELESTRTRMLTAKQQVSALEPIRGIKDRIAAAAERVRVIDEVGVFTDPSSLAALWNAQRRLDLLREVEVELGSHPRAQPRRPREARARRCRRSRA